MIHNFDEILTEAKKADKKVIAVPDPRSRRVFTAVQKAKEEKELIIPILVGDRRSIEENLSDLKIDAGGYEITDEPDTSRALTRSIEMLTHQEADMIFQGDISIKEFLKAVTDKETGITTADSLSYVSLFEIPHEDRMVFFTDTFIQEFPDLKQKISILTNAISLAGLLGIDKPKVAALTMVELVNLARQSTIDAAILSKMSERRQLNAIVDGPLDIDCASSLERARRKGVESPVAGKVDIFLFPDIESGYSTVELLAFLGGAKTAGALIGSNASIILNLRFESADSILIDIALASLMFQEH
jgi:phosphate butyryltransferase